MTLLGSAPGLPVVALAYPRESNLTPGAEPSGAAHPARTSGSRSNHNDFRRVKAEDGSDRSAFASGTAASLHGEWEVWCRGGWWLVTWEFGRRWCSNPVCEADVSGRFKP